MQTMEYLVSKTQLVVNLKNGNSFTALDMIKQMQRDPQTRQMRELLVQVGALKASSQGNNKKENLLENKRAAILVAATVVASMTFQAGINPPGGVWENNMSNHTNAYGDPVNVTVIAGTSIMATNSSVFYIIFEVFNTASFVAAISTVLLVVRGSPSFGTTWFRFLKQKVFMWILTGVIWISTTTMPITYLFGILAITPKNVGHEDTSVVIFGIAGFSILAWLGLIFIIFLVNICRFFIYIIRKVKKCRVRSRRNANESNLLGHSNA